MTCKKSTCCICSHLDSAFCGTAWVSLLAAICYIAAAFTLPESLGGKNSLPEYLQLAILAVGIVFCFRANNRRTFYTFSALVLIFLFLREINYGRTLPCFADPDNPEKFKKWKEIPYGWLAHVFVGIYLAAITAYFVWRKLWRDVWELLSTVRIPVWEAGIMFAAAVCAQLTERIFHNDFVEEFFELSFYTAFICLLWRYTRGHIRLLDTSPSGSPKP